jgi:hypothetical protein
VATIIDKNDQARKYLEYALQSNLAKLPQVRHRVLHLPTCAKCQRVAFRDRKVYDKPGNVYVTCPICGYHGPGGPPLKMVMKEA